MLFSPADIIYLPMLSGRPGELLPLSSCLADRETAKKSLTALQESYAWTRSGNGFILKIENINEVLGLIEVDGFTFPEYKQHYLNLALHMVKVLAITILNARNYEGLIKTGNALQESEERFRTLVENAPEGFYVISVDGIITSLNSAFEDITGWQRNEWLGRHFSDIVHPEDLPVAKKWFQQVLQGNKTPLYELRVLSKSGEYIIAEFISAPLIKNGNITGAFGIARDITERKHFEDALRDSEKKYRRLFENTSNGIVVFDSETLRFEDVNTACLNLYGYSKEEFLSLSPLDVSVEAEKSRIAIQKGLDSELTHIPLRYHKKKDGTVFPVEIFAGAFFHKGRKKGIGVIVDLTERMRSEEELRLAYREVKEKGEKLERFNRLMVGRELEMIRLKAEVNELLEKAGQPDRYETAKRVNKVNA